MSRSSRRGMVDLIVMIVMIVFLLGMGTLAFITFDKAEKEKQYLGALREIPARQNAELDAVRARYAEVCNYIGFKGEAAFSSPAAIQTLLNEGGEVVADFYDVADAAGASLPLTETESGRDIRLKVVEGGEEREIVIPVRQIRGTTRNSAKLYEAADIKTLELALGKQDAVIDGLVRHHIPRILSQRAFQDRYKAQKSSDKATESDRLYGDLSSKIEAANQEMTTRQEQVATAEQRLGETMKREVETYLQLDSETVREAREEAFAAAREAAKARREAREAMEAYRLQADKRRLDDTRDPDGAIFLVDDKSGYVWINIGQKSDVRKNQTFQVLRADASRSSEIQIGEIRVQEVLRGNIARCRVDALDDPGVYPQAGDIIRNPNFTDRQYHSWALAGEFGGKYTTLTRQQLTDLLRGVGFRVTNYIDATTDAVIIGGNWDKDPEFIRAEERRLNFEKYPEEEVLYFLGLTGPEKD
jgi:hypothetical protein